ncbi:MAG: S1C family serine protease [Syntrophales bacterium]
MHIMRLLLAGTLFLICLPGQSTAAMSAEEVLKAVVKVRTTIPKQAESARTLGTEREGNGVVIDADGTILTAGYLIRDAKSIEVTVLSGEPVSARFVAYDFTTGFGLVRAEKPLGLEPMPLGQSAAVKAGDAIVVAAQGGEAAVQVALVVSRGEFVGHWEYLLDEAIYTVPAHGRYAGAALIDAGGRLVGIGSLVTPVLVPEFGLISCNVSIPVDLLRPILANLIKTGRSGQAPRPWLGINAQEAHGRIFVTRIIPGSPAENAGLKPGDIFLTVAGKEITGLADFYRKVWATGTAGVQVPLGVLQGVKVREIKVRSLDRSWHSAPPRGDVTL